MRQRGQRAKYEKTEEVRLTTIRHRTDAGWTVWVGWYSSVIRTGKPMVCRQKGEIQRVLSCWT